MSNRIILSAVIICVSLAGCQALYDMWPCSIPRDTKNYTREEPNGFLWPTIAEAKELRENCITKNITTQIDLRAAMEKDSALYARAIDQANFNITTAENEREQIIGTLQNPGWLLSFLLPASGALAGRTITKLTHYSEEELQKKLADVKASNQT